MPGCGLGRGRAERGRARRSGAGGEDDLAPSEPARHRWYTGRSRSPARWFRRNILDLLLRQVAVKQLCLLLLSLLLLLALVEEVDDTENKTDANVWCGVVLTILILGECPHRLVGLIIKKDPRHFPPSSPPPLLGGQLSHNRYEGCISPPRQRSGTLFTYSQW